MLGNVSENFLASKWVSQLCNELNVAKAKTRGKMILKVTTWSL